jgi:hypothetical protein
MLDKVTLGYCLVWEASFGFPKNSSATAAYLLIYHPWIGIVSITGIFPLTRCHTSPQDFKMKKACFGNVK